ncbi:MAG: type III pantothenate kinase [Idiomarina sp.]|nr:type III pantothenate kinase [Idiomarina sp.]
MKLVELGNTRWKLADYTDHTLKFLGHGIGLNDLLLVLGQYTEEQVIFASVASEDVNERLEQRLKEAGISYIQVHTRRSYGEVVNSYHHYQRLGVDRWLTLIAAHRNQKGYSAVVDVGTAVTFDLLHKDGRHLGGWIAPGLHSMQDALVAKSSRIRARYDAPREALGQSTEDGLYLGCKAAVQGFIQQAYEHVRDTVSEPVLWLFSGGGLDSLDIHGIHNVQIRPHLVLEGLAVVADDL